MSRSLTFSSGHQSPCSCSCSLSHRFGLPRRLLCDGGQPAPGLWRGAAGLASARKSPCDWELGVCLGRAPPSLRPTPALPPQVLGPGADVKAGWQRSHDEAVAAFLGGAGGECLFASADAAGRLVLGSALPPEPAAGCQRSRVLYVLRDAAAAGERCTEAAAAAAPGGAAGALESCICGYLDAGDALGSLQQLLALLFAPALLAASEEWPDTLRQVCASWGRKGCALCRLLYSGRLGTRPAPCPSPNNRDRWVAPPPPPRQDFVGAAHRYLGALTEAQHAQQGRTVLYVPDERIPDPPAAAARQRELVQHLESCLLHWTEQIGELLNRRGARRAGSTAGRVCCWLRIEAGRG